jgi:hypothetical protein
MRLLLAALPFILACGCAPRSMLLVGALVPGSPFGPFGGPPRPVVPEEPEVDLGIETVRPGEAGPVDLQPSAPPPPARPFDLGGAYAAIGRVDLSSCKVTGLAPGYGRVEVGFMVDGAVGGVALELPSASSPAARSCVEEAYRTVRVPGFAGEQPATVRRDFFVR